jgi:hypothetical protein
MQQPVEAGRTSGGECIQPDQQQFDSPLWHALSLEHLGKVHGGSLAYLLWRGQQYEEEQRILQWLEKQF